MIFTKYFFWLFTISLIMILLERIFYWRKQTFYRNELGQDFFWLIFNGYFSKIIFYNLLPILPIIFSNISNIYLKLFRSAPKDINLFGNYSFIYQLLLYIIISDFIEWLVHNMLHRIDFLWKIHRVHHSIKIMDWIGNFRFHWGETIIYSTFKYLPITLMGVNWRVILVGSVIATTIGHLNHSNLRISWGPLRYLLNSPRMHIWHHEKNHRGKAGVNFGIVFSIWDWIFHTAYMPLEIEGPDDIGYKGEQNVPSSLLFRFFLPFYTKKEI